MSKKSHIILGLLFAVAACGSKPESSDGAETTVAPAAAGTAASDGTPASFGQCATCHKVAKDGGNGLGPNLHGVVGRKAAVVAGFNYSTALKDWGQSWTESNLDKYIENPRSFIAGNRMSFAGIKDAAKRKEVIDWLKKNG